MNKIDTHSSAPNDPLAVAHGLAEEPVIGHACESDGKPGRRAVLMLGALGVVFGDIGTSPIYALRESVLATSRALPPHAAVMGALSLIFWALIIVVTLKYVILIMRADNNGEGGVLALATLAHRSPGLGARYQDGDRHRGHHRAGAVLWRRHADARDLGAQRRRRTDRRPPFARAPGAADHADHPGRPVPDAEPRHGEDRPPVRTGDGGVVRDIGHSGHRRSCATRSSWRRSIRFYGLALFIHAPWTAFVALGSVVLAVTGCEALYADMGHFGRKPIQAAWLYFALPALVLDYFGQGAALLAHPHMVNIAFYSMAPHWAHLPLVVLATVCHRSSPRRP